ncbi:MAG: cytochrome P450 [Pseudobacteriovorax sp.]|nr:cytochrome P450 [Pseudobacteriovorax sp.]
MQFNVSLILSLADRLGLSQRVTKRLKLNRVELINIAAKKVGGIGEVNFGSRKFVIANEVEDISEILIKKARFFEKGSFQKFVIGSGEGVRGFGNGILTSSNEDHKHQMRLMGKFFSKNAVDSYTDTIAKIALDHCHSWRQWQEIDVGLEMMAIAVDSILRTLFTKLVSRQEIINLS